VFAPKLSHVFTATSLDELVRPGVLLLGLEQLDLGHRPLNQLGGGGCHGATARGVVVAATGNAISTPPGMPGGPLFTRALVSQLHSEQVGADNPPSDPTRYSPKNSSMPFVEGEVVRHGHGTGKQLYHLRVLLKHALSYIIYPRGDVRKK
jgi:hypothetical protein